MYNLTVTAGNKLYPSMKAANEEAKKPRKERVMGMNWDPRKQVSRPLIMKITPVNGAIIFMYFISGNVAATHGPL